MYICGDIHINMCMYIYIYMARSNEHCLATWGGLKNNRFEQTHWLGGPLGVAGWPGGPWPAGWPMFLF